MAPLIALVVATFYVGYTGDVFCLDATPADLQAAGVQWVAVDVAWYTTGAVHCGDLLMVTFPGHTLKAYALDAGPLGAYRVDGLGTIALDVPAHLWPLAGMAARVKVQNVTAILRRRIVQ